MRFERTTEDKNQTAGKDGERFQKSCNGAGDCHGIEPEK